MIEREFTGTNTLPAKAGRVFPVLCIIFILQLSSSIHAQWKPLFHRIGGFQVIYFLDLPGFPQIGFLGTGDSLFKTTNGGNTWSHTNFQYLYLDEYPPGDVNIFPGEIFSDIAFKNSKIGWAATFTGLYKTTDGGDTWFFLDTGFFIAVYYDQTSGGLFISSFGGGSPVWQLSNELSWDEGATWEPFGWDENESSGGFTFADGNNGLLSWGDYHPDETWWRTTDGGKSWASIPFDSSCWQPLAISETSTYFANTQWGTILRTDDAGNNWKQLYKFSSENLTGTESGLGWCTSSSCIRGTLDSLYVMMPSGCYLSTDQGKNWKNLCGPPDLYWTVQRFYLKDKNLYVIGNDSTYSTLWHMNLDSLNTFSSSLHPLQNTASGSGMSVLFQPQIDSGALVDTAHFTIRYDTSLLLKSLSLPHGWNLLDSSSNGNTLNVTIFDTLSTISTPSITLNFQPILTPSISSGKVWLDSANLYGKWMNCDIYAQSTSAPDSVEIDFTGCGDSTILAAMQGELPFSIVSIQPNPASSELTVSLVSPTGAAVGYEMYNALGERVLAGPTTPQPPPIPLRSIGGGVVLDVSSVPSGVYYLRFSSGGYVQTRSVVIER